MCVEDLPLFKLLDPLTVSVMAEPCSVRMMDDGDDGDDAYDDAAYHNNNDEDDDADNDHGLR